MIELLISKGARVDVIDATTQLTPLVAAMVVTERGPFAQLERSRAANIVEALLNGGANPNQTLKAGESPLMLAVGMNNLQAVQLLLARGANPNLRDANQSTALHVAYATERPATMIDALTTAGADPNLRDAQGKLPHELSPQFVAVTPPAAAPAAPASAAVQSSAVPATEPPKLSMTKWLIGGAVVATAVVGAAVLAHLVKEQKKKGNGAAAGNAAIALAAALVPPKEPPAPTPPPAPVARFDGAYGSRTVLADGFTHTEKGSVNGVDVSMLHEFVSSDGRTRGAFRWKGKLTPQSGQVPRADLGGEGTIDNAGIRPFTLTGGTITTTPDGGYILCWKGGDPKFGAIGGCARKGFIQVGDVLPKPPVVLPPVVVARPDPKACTTITVLDRKAVQRGPEYVEGYPSDPCAHSFDYQVAINIRTTCSEPVVVVVDGWGSYFGADGKQGRVKFGQVVNASRQRRVCGEPRGVCYQADYASGKNCTLESGLRLMTP
jgi:hypothetical protein